MTDIDDLWKQIDKEFDQDDSIEVVKYLKNKGITKQILAESVAQSAENLVDLTFNPEILTKDTKLSKYKIIKQINSGGQSEIYLAQRSDGVYEKTVVIKFIAQRYSFDVLRQQFLQEMQLLADLNHPGIVQILDGGITNDQPWLVLEYINGLHIDEYCQQSNLSPRQIIKLFLNLCESLNFVHQRGVVHMDIKASNILINKINNIPYPVIIDFGIANTDVDNNKQTNVFGTKGFSAPEQLTGSDPNHRADIYSLGMLMAQLLTNNDVDNIGLLNNKQRDDLLSKHKVKNDLIQIIHKSIQQDPNNRYQNTESLRNDLNNYLNDLPIAANQNHLGHIIVKTYRRHKFSSLLSLLTLISAIGFGIKYTSDISNLQHVTNEAKINSDELFNFMLNDLFTNLSQIGRTDILTLVTEKSIEHLHNQNSMTLGAKTYLQRAKAYTNAGKVYDSLKLSDKAVKTYDEGIKNLSFVANNNKYKKSYLYQMALIKNLKSLTLTAKGQQQLTEQNLLESLQLSDKLFKLYPHEDLYIKYEAHTQLGWYYMEYDNAEKAFNHINLAIDTAKEMNDRKLNYQWIFNLSQAYQVLAWYEFDYGDASKAIPTLINATELANKTVDEDGSSIRYFFNQTTLLNQLSYFYLESKDSDDAKKVIDKAILIGKQLQQKAPKNLDYQRELAYSYTTAGQLAELQKDFPLSLDFFNQSLIITRLMYQNDSDDFSTANDYANDLIHLGMVHEKLAQDQQAKELWKQAIDIMKPVHILEPNNKYYTNTLISALLNSGDYQQAKPLIAELKQSGFNDSDFEELLKQHNLN